MHCHRTQPDTRKEMKLTPKTFFQSQPEAGPSCLAPSVDNGQEATRYDNFVQLFDGWLNVVVGSETSSMENWNWNRLSVRHRQRQDPLALQVSMNTLENILRSYFYFELYITHTGWYHRSCNNYDNHDWFCRFLDFVLHRFGYRWTCFDKKSF
jgi:hypothetical protein